MQHVLLSNFSPGWGYTAIAVALLGGLMPFGVLLRRRSCSARSRSASTNMQYAAGVPTSVGSLIEGLILVFFLLSIPLTLSRRRRRARLQHAATPSTSGRG